MAAAVSPAKTQVRAAAAAAQAADRCNDRPAITNLRLRATLALAAIASLTASSSKALAGAAPPASCEREITLAAHRYEIPLAVFYAVGLNETGARGRLQPYSMNVDGRPTVSTSLPEALARFRRAKAEGARMIDIGCMQINHHYHAAHFASLEAMFDPAQNIDYAARFLLELKSRERTWTMAVARYNAGPDNDPAQKRYVCGVLTKMVASGFGAWTESARQFCFSTPVAKAPL